MGCNPLISLVAGAGFIPSTFGVWTPRSLLMLRFLEEQNINTHEFQRETQHSPISRMLHSSPAILQFRSFETIINYG